MSVGRNMTNLEKEALVRDNVRELVTLHGKAAVKQAVKLEAKGRVGRPNKGDWLLLTEVLDADALHWLDGRIPRDERSNRSIAIEFSGQHPDDENKSIYQRFMRKLRKRRFYHGLIHAQRIAHDQRPHEHYLRAIRALCKTGIVANSWASRLDMAEADIRRFTSTHGMPSIETTMAEIEAGVRQVKLRSGSESPNYIAKIMRRKSND